MIMFSDALFIGRCTNYAEEAREIANRHAAIVPGFRVSAWAARTPMQGDIRQQRINRLLAAGMPE